MRDGAGICKWCGKAIKWAKTEKGHAIPLDPDPVQDGNVEVVNGIAKVWGGDNLLAQRDVNTVLHKAHFATCESPFNPKNRKRKR